MRKQYNETPKRKGSRNKWYLKTEKIHWCISALKLLSATVPLNFQNEIQYFPWFPTHTASCGTLSYDQDRWLPNHPDKKEIYYPRGKWFEQKGTMDLENCGLLWKFLATVLFDMFFYSVEKYVTYCRKYK